MIVRGNNQIRLVGPLTVPEVSALYAEGLPSFIGGECVVDMAGVENVDSAALALLLCWQRAAQRAQARLRVCHVPDNLRALAAMYGLADLLSRLERPDAVAAN